MSLTRDELLQRARRVRLVIFDVDGVLTDGLLHYGSDGEAFKTFHVRDGHGIVLLRLAGIPQAILSARESEAVRTRMRELGVRYVLQGERDKAAGLERLLAQAEVSAEACAYIGDDVNDIPVLEKVGLAACPADAAPEAKRHAHLVTSATGGRGAARELCELVLEAHGKWPG